MVPELERVARFLFNYSLQVASICICVDVVCSTVLKTADNDPRVTDRKQDNKGCSFKAWGS